MESINYKPASAYNPETQSLTNKARCGKMCSSLCSSRGKRNSTRGGVGIELLSYEVSALSLLDVLAKT